MLFRDQAIDAVERDAAVVADDAAAAIGIGQAGDDAGLAASPDLVGVGVEHAVVVGLAVFRKGLVHLRVGLETGRFQPGLDHAQAAERKDGALERLVGLQPDDHLVVAIDIAGLVRQHGRRMLGIDRGDSLLLLFPKVGLKLGPYRLGALGRSGEALLVAE